MIAILLSFVYISAICWTYGRIVLFAITKFISDAPSFNFHPAIVCMTGMAFLGILTTAVSLFMPIGGVFIQVFLLLPSVIWLGIRRPEFTTLVDRLRKWFRYSSPGYFLLLASCISVVLVMAAGPIDHPDTFMYHVQNIHWATKYPAVPGIANIFYPYGLQSSWFVLCGLFSFDFVNSSAISFLPPVVMIWYLCFICRKIFPQKNNGKANAINEILPWILLLIFSMWSFTMLRLTAGSASPDFIATLFAWLMFYIFISKSTNTNRQIVFVLVLLGSFAISIKLSVLPVMLLCMYSGLRFFSANKIKTFFSLVILILLLTAPILIRNFVSTGYFLFPSTVGSWVWVDWQVPAEIMQYYLKYIPSFARTNFDESVYSASEVFGQPVTKWFPVWWKIRSTADKTLLLVVPLTLIMYVFQFRKKIQRDETIRIAFLIALVGSVFWFLTVPDTRFGYGFLIPLIAIANLQFQDFKLLVSSRIFYLIIIFPCCIALISYSVFRFNNFFRPGDFLVPAGVINKPYKILFTCKGIPISVQFSDQPCGQVDVPCTIDSCGNFEPRGIRFEDGFRSMQQRKD